MVEVTVILPQTLAQGVHVHYACAQVISVLFMLVGLGWVFRSIHQHWHTINFLFLLGFTLVML